MNDLYAIPPLGQIGPDDHAVVHSYLQGLAEEASTAQADGIARADASISIYLNGDTTIPDEDQVVSPEIQNVVIAVTDLQTREPPTAKLNPVETGEPSTDYWCGPQLQPQAQLDPTTGQPIAVGMPFGLSPDQVSPWTDAMGATQPPNPLSEEQADAIEQAIAAGVAKRRWLVRIDDKLVSEVYQTVKDVLASRSRFSRVDRSNLLRTNIEGWSLWLYEWDDRRKRHVITPLSLRQVYIDPTIEDIEDAAYAGIDHYIDASKSKGLYPHLAQDIDEYAKTGQPRVPSGAGNSLPGAFDRDFKRPMVTLRIFWLRDQEIPLGREDAIQAGLLRPVQLPDEEAMMGMQAAGQMMDPTMPPMREALVHAETGQEVDEQSQEWPTRLGIRQLTELVETATIVDDRECEYADIPLLHNVSIPIPGSPEGIGMPYNLYKMQRGVTKTLTGMVDHIDNYAHSTPVLSETTAADLHVAAGDVWKKCGRAIVLRDDVYQNTQGQIHTINPPPPLNEGLVQVESILRSRMREDSGYTDKLRGVTSGNESGRAIDLAQQAATTQIGFKSQRTGDMIYRRSILELGSIRRMSVDDIARIISKYPRHILAKIHERFARTEFDVLVTVYSSAGQSLEIKKQAAREDFKLGLRDKESTQEIIGIDPQLAAENQRKEMRTMAEAVNNAAPQQQGQEPQKKAA